MHVLVGWTHHEIPNGIDLCMQSTRSKIALENDQIESMHLLLTNNQALLLANYLLKTSKHTLPDPPGFSFRRAIRNGIGIGKRRG